MPNDQAHKNRLKALDDRADYVRYHADGYTKDTKGLGYRSANFTDFKKRSQIEEMNKPGMQGPPKPDRIAVDQIVGKQTGAQPNPGQDKKGPWVKVGRGPQIKPPKTLREAVDNAADNSK
jgi:hypothetical protein